MTHHVEFYANIGEENPDCLFNAEVETSQEIWDGDGPYCFTPRTFIDEVRITQVTIFDDAGFDVLHSDVETLRLAGLPLPSDDKLEQQAIDQI